jgi:spermidine synthase
MALSVRLFILYALFLLSGATGLIYQLVWTRKLILILGGTTYAITTVVVAFMSGLALGSYVAGRLSPRLTQPGRWYGAMEIAVGAYALIVPLLLALAEPLYGWLYARTADTPAVLTAVRFLVGGVVLLAPTTLMGATLPLLVRFVTLLGGRFGQSVGLLYGINTFGAFIGTLLAGFWLIQELGLSVTTRVAAAANVVIGLVAIAILRTGSIPVPRPAEQGRGEKRLPDADGPPVSDSLRRAVLIGFAVSGFAAMVYQITWTRTLVMSLGSSTYAFTCILAAFIFGLAAGSVAVARWIDRWRDPAWVFALFELGIAVSAVLIVPLYHVIPPAARGLVVAYQQEYSTLLAAQFLLIIAVTLIPTFLMGAIMPLVARIVARRRDDSGAAVGRAYAVNTIGNILGAFLAGFILIRGDVLGVQRSIVLAALLNAGVGVTIALMSRPPQVTFAARVRAPAIMTALVLAIAVFSGSWSRISLTSGPYLPADRKHMQDEVVYFGEGVDSTVAVHRSRENPEDLTLTMNGKPDASSGVADMLSRMLMGHLPALLADDPQSACVVGLGGGYTLAAVTRHPSIKEVDCVEICEEVVACAPYFAPFTHHVLEDPKVRLILADGRNHLLLTGRKYDLIVSEPTNLWIAGVANLFTREYFQLCHDRLSDRGVFCAWLQGYSMQLEDFRMVVRTLMDVFPSVTIWGSAEDYFLIARREHERVPLGRVMERFAQPAVRADLYRAGGGRLAGLLGAFVTDDDALRRWVSDASSLHTDDNAVIEFSSARNLYRGEVARITRELHALSRSPFAQVLGLDETDPRQTHLVAETEHVRSWREHMVASHAAWERRDLLTAWEYAALAYERNPGSIPLRERVRLIGSALRTHQPDAARSERARRVIERLSMLPEPVSAPRGGAPLASIAAGLRERGEAERRQGRLDIAEGYLMEADELTPNDGAVVGSLALVCDALGRRAEADALIAEHRAAAPRDTAMSYAAGVLAARRGHLDVAVRYLEESVRGGHIRVDELAGETELTALRLDPRFQGLIGRGAATSRSTSRASTIAE